MTAYKVTYSSNLLTFFAPNLKRINFNLLIPTHGQINLGRR